MVNALTTTPNSTRRFPIGATLAAVAIGICGGLLVANVTSILKLSVILISFSVVFFMFVKAELGLLALIFLTYTRISDVMVHSFGLPSIAQPFVVLLLLIIAVRWILSIERPTGWEGPSLYLLVYGLVGFVSIFYAADLDKTYEAIVDYAKDAIITLVTIMLLKKFATLRLVIWTLLAAGIFMGSITVYQYLTGTFTNDYGGFGQAEIMNISATTSDYRISGPIGDPNFYAQIMLVLVPLALNRIWNERAISLRILAVWALTVCILSIIFTFSRGAAIGLLVMLCIILVRSPPKTLEVVLGVIAVILLLPFIPTEYTDRIQTLLYALPGFGPDLTEEVSFRGRMSEMLVGFQMFLDHPLGGVGLNNFTVFYQNYSQGIGLDPRMDARSAHSLFLQIAAETGLMGLTAFGVLLWRMFSEMWKAQRNLTHFGMNDASNMVAAINLGLVGYLSAAVFLHSSYPRFFWLLAGISFAVPKIVANSRLGVHVKRKDNGPALS